MRYTTFMKVNLRSPASGGFFSALLPCLENSWSIESVGVADIQLCLHHPFWDIALIKLPIIGVVWSLWYEATSL